MNKQADKYIKCCGDSQRVTLVKQIDGVHTIVRKHYKDTKVSELNQNTYILNDMMFGTVMTRDRARKTHQCEKMPTRISDIRHALKPLGLSVSDKKVKLPSKKQVKNYFLDPVTIKRIEEL